MHYKKGADELKKQSESLSSTILSTAVVEAKIRRFDRSREDFLADNNLEKAGKIEAEKNQFLQAREKQIQAVRNLENQIQIVEAKIKGLIRPVFFYSIDAIKRELAKQLSLTLSFKNVELQEFVSLQSEYGIQLPFNPLSEVKLYPEGPLRRIREMLEDELLPTM